MATPPAREQQVATLPPYSQLPPPYSPAREQPAALNSFETPPAIRRHPGWAPGSAPGWLGTAPTNHGDSTLLSPLTPQQVEIRDSVLRRRQALSERRAGLNAMAEAQLEDARSRTAAEENRKAAEENRKKMLEKYDLLDEQDRENESVLRGCLSEGRTPLYLNPGGQLDSVVRQHMFSPPRPSSGEATSGGNPTTTNSDYIDPDPDL